MDLTSGIRELYDVIYKIAKSVFYYSMINAHRHVFWMGWPNKEGFEKTCWSRSNRYLKAWIMKFNQLRLHFFLAFDKHIVINNFLDKQYRKKRRKKPNWNAHSKSKIDIEIQMIGSWVQLVKKFPLESNAYFSLGKFTSENFVRQIKTAVKNEKKKIKEIIRKKTITTYLPSNWIMNINSCLSAYIHTA